jgi:hypothetical protein
MIWFVGWLIAVTIIILFMMGASERRYPRD